MFTTCPQCALNLALTVTDLRLGQGYVRCGRCSNVFNALLALSEEGDGSTPVAASPAAQPEELVLSTPQSLLDAANAAPDQAKSTESGDQIPSDEGAAAQAESVDPVDAEGPDESPAADLPPHVSAAPPAEGIELADDEPLQEIDPNEATGEVEVLRTGTFETIVLEGEGILQTEETVTESEVDAQLQALVQRFDAVRESEEANFNALWPPGEDVAEPEFDLADDDEAPPLSAAQREEFELDEAQTPDTVRPLQDYVSPPAGLAPAPPPAGEPDGLADVFAMENALAAGTPPQDARLRARWFIGCAVLLLALAAQLIHHNRQALVGVSALSAPMTRLYGAFHVVLEPHWDLKAYDVRQLGADAVPGETPHIAVRASIQNRAQIAQPAPLLRVVLQDRYGNQIATREVAPLEYLRGGAPSRLAADQRVDAELLLPDPGQAAVGFEIDACLRSADAVLRCASDPASH
jgi:predicted Zn finger-like uncharacterized protein